MEQIASNTKQSNLNNDQLNFNNNQSNFNDVSKLFNYFHYLLIIFKFTYSLIHNLQLIHVLVLLKKLIYL